MCVCVCSINQSYLSEIHWDKFTTAWICVKPTIVQFCINIYYIANCLPVSISVPCLFSISEKLHMCLQGKEDKFACLFQF